MMRVYCTDGTVFECERYEVTEFGLVAYGQDNEPAPDRYDDEGSEQIAFVPHDRLWYVLPSGVAPQTAFGVPQGRGVQPGDATQPAPQQSTGNGVPPQPGARGP